MCSNMPEKIGMKETPVKVAFTTWIADSRQFTGRWLPGLLLTFGYTWPKEEPVPVPVIALDKVVTAARAAKVGSWKYN
jgi:hypothetical protein